MEISAVIQTYPTISHASGSIPSSQEIEESPNRQILNQAPARVSGRELTDEQKRKVEELKEKDRKVRAHEQAHLAMAGQYAIGGPNFEYETGPDGKRYAVGGEVKLDASEVPGNPEATIRKMQQIRRAALAPRDPSAQDRRVAAEASRKEAEARREIMEERRKELQGLDSDFSSQVVTGRYFSSENSAPNAPPPDIPLIDVTV